MRAPPPWCLPAAMAIAAALLAALYPAYGRDNEAALEAWPELVERAVGRDREPGPPDARGRSRLGVVALGSSLLTCSTRHNWHMDSLSKEMEKRPLRWRKICVAGHAWDILPLLEAGVAAKPQVLVLESNLLFQRSRDGETEESAFEVFLSYVRFRVNQVVPIGGGKPRRRWPSEILSPPSDNPTPVVLTPDHLARSRRSRERNFHPEDVDRYLPVLNRAREAGVTVVMLDLALQGAPLPWTAEQRRAIDVMHGRLEKEAGVRIFRYPHPLERSDFYDAAHLSPAGREKFSRWLVEELDALPVP